MRKPGRKPGSIYFRSLTEAEKLLLPAARKMEGIDEEIAVLRVRLNSALQDEKSDFRVLLQGVDMLVKAVATQYRLSPKARKDLADKITGLLNSLGDQLLPAGR